MGLGIINSINGLYGDFSRSYTEVRNRINEGWCYRHLNVNEKRKDILVDVQMLCQTRLVLEELMNLFSHKCKLCFRIEDLKPIVFIEIVRIVVFLEEVMLMFVAI